MLQGKFPQRRYGTWVSGLLLGSYSTIGSNVNILAGGVCILFVSCPAPTLPQDLYSHTLARYNYVLSGSLDIGTALCITFVGLGLGLSNANFPNWWGNTVPFNNLDANAAAVTKTLPDDGVSAIGPSHW